MRTSLNRIVTRDRIVRVDRFIRRFDPEQRLEHIGLMVAVGVLLLTGLPQKFSQWPVSRPFISLLGGIETARLIHRGAAVLLIGVVVAHALGVAYRLLVLRYPPHILLLTRDLRALLKGIRHRLGWGQELPDMGRFTYHEKLLYWMVVWSVGILSVTGLMMWNPVATTRFLTGELIPAAKNAHGSEALFLLMAGVGWHTWHVLRQRNWSIFTGVMAETDMLRDHPLEWDAVMQGRDQLPLDLGAVRRRRRTFALLAVPLTLALVGCLVAFVAFEQTAVVTHEARQPTEVISASGGESLLADMTQSEARWPSPTWNADIEPLLEEKCGACHGQGNDLNLTDYDAALDGSIVPGDASRSSLVTVQAGRDHPGRLSGDELVRVIVWIASGAPR